MIILLTVCYFMTDPHWLLEPGVPAFVLYPLFHANIPHLALNCIALWAALDPRHKDRCRSLIVASIVSMLVYPLASRPVVGISNILYALFGLRTPAIDSPWWKAPSTLTFLIVTLAMWPLPMFSVTTHIASFIIGAAIAALNRYTERLDNDAKRAGG